MAFRPDSLVADRGRRQLLIGGAATLALPFLESLARPRLANAWTAAPGMPRRLLVFFNGHGLIMESFVPGPNMAMGQILQPIADAGLTSKTLVVTGVNSKVQHGHDGAPSLLTCTPVRANQYGVTHATTASVDHVIARHMQDGGVARRLDLGVDDRSTSSGGNGLSNEPTRTYWSGNNELIETIIRPQLAFERVFETGIGGGGNQASDAVTARRRSVLDAVLENFNTLQNRVSAADRERLQTHAEKIRELEQSIETTVAAGPPPPTPASCEENLDLGSVNGISHARAAEMQVDILSYALACNHADVGTFKVFDLEEGAWGHISHPDLAPTFGGENYHGAWHRASDQTQPSARRAFTAINTWFGELFARLLRNLDQIDEGDGTALDNTMVLWVSDFGHGGGHSSDNLPIVFAGNAGGAALGRHVNYAANPTSPYGASSQPGNHNLAVTMTQAFGIGGDRFGNYNSVQQSVGAGPLSL